ncbi:hypothetical protein ACQPX6_24705 [Actinomycetospora sp. CA-101289]|uniref:hypothetical protein n=1 Tax=Actinomycetospora sp. CA-101289 TaxID=3239893 RepID=UPI003D965F91
MPRLSCRSADPFRGSFAVARGDVTWERLRRHEFRKLRPDTYVGSATPDDLWLRVRGLAVWAGPEAVVAGPVAALAWEAECPWDDDEVVLPTSRHPGPGAPRVRRDVLAPGEVTRRWGTPITTPARTAFDLAGRAPLPDAVAAVDALAHAWRFGPDDLAALVDAHPGVRGLVQVRRVIGLMDARAESLPESRLRVGLALRGVPSPVPQYPVRLPNGRGVRLDLAWPCPGAGLRPVALEYDGPEHRTIRGHGLDLDRDAGLDDLGWDVVRVTARQMHDLDALAARVLRKLGL